MDNPPVITYGVIKEIVAAFKQIAAEEYGLILTAGATFDPGPEFAHSEFKYTTHPEIIGGGIDTKIGPAFAMVNAWSTLRGDQNCYAAYPEGIPDGTPFGVFLGKQSQSFCLRWVLIISGFPMVSGSLIFRGLVLVKILTAPDSTLRITKNSPLRYFPSGGSLRRTVQTSPVEVRGTNFGTGWIWPRTACPLKSCMKEVSCVRLPATLRGGR